MSAPLIVGLKGQTLSANERAFLADVRPCGIIVFARNLSDDGDKVRALIDGAREAADCRLVLVDQEGGRVQRLKPPLAPLMPPAAAIGALHAKDAIAGRRAAYLAGRLIGHDVARLGFTAPCLPVADVPVEGAHDVIGDRAYARDPAAVAGLAAEAAKGVLAAGCVSVVKHIPGHGRAGVDSHHDCPVVDAPMEELERDFTPFRILADLPAAMTAHVVYTAIDRERPATVSPAAIQLIRDHIGFGGLLMTDDISMGALKGSIGANAAAALSAGCDIVLHCNGVMDEMTTIAAALPEMGEAAQDRLASALAAIGPGDRAHADTLRDELAALLAVA
ncbi:MAG: beta-N-acetylhexosaminidase [Pseudomonadota bacterium]